MNAGFYLLPTGGEALPQTQYLLPKTNEILGEIDYWKIQKHKKKEK